MDIKHHTEIVINRNALATEAEASAHRAWVNLKSALPYEKKALRKYFKEKCRLAEHLRWEANLAVIARAAAEVAAAKAAANASSIALNA